MMGNWWGPGGWGMGFGSLFMILFWILVAAGIGVVIRGALKPRDEGDRPPRERTPLDIASERYARGEIGRDEYEQIRRDLT